MEITPKLLADTIHALPEEKRGAVLLHYFFDMCDPDAMIENVKLSDAKE